MKNLGTLKVTTPSDREVVMTRIFDALRELVYEAWTRPDLLQRWLWGPDDWQLAICEIDLRIGGAFRFVWRQRDGMANDMGMGGVYSEIVPSARLVFTEVWDEDWTGGEALVTIVFSELAGKTTMTQTVLYSSRAARDGALKTGMEHGAAVSYDRLAALLPSLHARAKEKKRDNPNQNIHTIIQLPSKHAAAALIRLFVWLL